MPKNLNNYTLELFYTPKDCRVKTYSTYHRARANAKIHLKRNRANGSPEFPKARIVDPSTGAYELYFINNNEIVTAKG